MSNTITTNQLIDRAKVIQLHPTDPATFVIMIAGKLYDLSSPEAKQHVVRLAEQINMQLEDNRHLYLLANIPSMGYVEPEDL